MTTSERDKLSKVLTATYGAMIDHDRLTALWRQLGRENAEVVAAAIDAHITDTTIVSDGRAAGTYPPKPSDLAGRIRRMRDEARETERREQEETYRRVRDGSGGRKIPFQIPAEIRKKAPYLPNISYTWTSDCHECSDTGLASFFAQYDPEKDRYVPGRVWLRSEALKLSDEKLATMRRQTAVCDCQRGRVRPERMLTTSVWSQRQGREVEVNTYPRLETIRRIAERRPNGMDRAVSGGNSRPGGNRSGGDAAIPPSQTEATNRQRQDRVGVTGPAVESGVSDSHSRPGRATPPQVSGAGEPAASRPPKPHTEVIV